MLYTLACNGISLSLRSLVMAAVYALACNACIECFYGGRLYTLRDMLRNMLRDSF